MHRRPQRRLDLGLRFDNSFARLPGAFYTRLPPAPLPDPYLVGFSKAAGELIGVGEDEVPALIDAMAGNRQIAGTDPLAAVYSGHQFGVYVPRLGDGRALLLGEAIGPPESIGSCSSRAQARRRIRAWATGAPYCAHRFANFWAPRLCIIWEFQRPARWR